MMHGRYWKSHCPRTSSIIKPGNSREKYSSTGYINKYNTLPTFRIRHLDNKRLECVISQPLLLDWINWLCLKILISNFSQTIGLGTQISTKPLTVLYLRDEFNEFSLCGVRWQKQKQKKRLCLDLKQNNSKCHPRGLTADNEFDVHFSDFRLGLI